MYEKYLCVDFDGTIVDHCFPRIGAPVPGAITWLKFFQKAGIKIILFTMRSDSQQFGDVLTKAVEYLEERGIELFGVNINPTQSQWTSSPKAYAHVYIDDAGVGCPLIQYKGFYRKCVDWCYAGKLTNKTFGIKGNPFDGH